MDYLKVHLVHIDIDKSANKDYYFQDVWEDESDSWHIREGTKSLGTAGEESEIITKRFYTGTIQGENWYHY